MYSKGPLKGEIESDKYPGLYLKDNGVYRKPYVWNSKENGNRAANLYYVEVCCDFCGVKTLKAKHCKATKSSFCSMKCRSKARELKDGTKRMPRGEDGYVFVKSSSHPSANRFGFVHEHRLVVEKNIGRYLDRNEIVHHINCIKKDNRIENLHVFESDSDHFLSHGSINKCISDLLDMGQLIFNKENGSYEIKK